MNFRLNILQKKKRIGSAHTHIYKHTNVKNRESLGGLGLYNAIFNLENKISPAYITFSPPWRLFVTTYGGDCLINYSLWLSRLNKIKSTLGKFKLVEYREREAGRVGRVEWEGQKIGGVGKRSTMN